MLGRILETGSAVPVERIGENPGRLIRESYGSFEFSIYWIIVKSMPVFGGITCRTNLLA
jgi:hypothetical protein